MSRRDSSSRDAYTTALVLLGVRELSEAQLRQRLLRRQCDADDVEATIARLKRDRTLDDGRVARAAARIETTIRHRGRHRTLLRLRALGIAEETARDAVDEVLAEVDESALLDRAIERRLRGTEPGSLDRTARARLVRALVGQGFSSSAIFARLRAKARASGGD